MASAGNPQPCAKERDALGKTAGVGDRSVEHKDGAFRCKACKRIKEQCKHEIRLVDQAVAPVQAAEVARCAVHAEQDG